MKKIRLSDLKICIAILLERRKRGSRAILSEEIDFHQVIQSIIFFAENLYIMFLGPLNDLLVAFLSVRGVVKVESD